MANKPATRKGQAQPPPTPPSDEQQIQRLHHNNEFSLKLFSIIVGIIFSILAPVFYGYIELKGDISNCKIHDAKTDGRILILEAADVSIKDQAAANTSDLKKVPQNSLEIAELKSKVANMSKDLEQNRNDDLKRDLDVQKHASEIADLHSDVKDIRKRTKGETLAKVKVGPSNCNQACGTGNGSTHQIHSPLVTLNIGSNNGAFVETNNMPHIERREAQSQNAAQSPAPVAVTSENISQPRRIFPAGTLQELQAGLGPMQAVTCVIPTGKMKSSPTSEISEIITSRLCSEIQFLQAESRNSMKEIIENNIIFWLSQGSGYNEKMFIETNMNLIINTTANIFQFRLVCELPKKNIVSMNDTGNLLSSN